MLDKIIEDKAAALRAIVDYLADSDGPVCDHELAVMLHLPGREAESLCNLLQKAGYIDHPVVHRTVLGVNQAVPQLGWRLDLRFRLAGRAFDAEALAGGRVV